MATWNGDIEVTYSSYKKKGPTVIEEEERIISANQ